MITTARSSHLCSICGKTIHAGEQMRNVSLIQYIHGVAHPRCRDEWVRTKQGQKAYANCR